VLGISWLDPSYIFQNGGSAALWIVVAIIFAECGLLIGFFLPGDTLLFSVGVLTATGVVRTPIWLSCVLLTVAAILGNLTGYEIGRKAGPAVLSSERLRLLKPEHVARTEAFFDRYGAPAIILARFVPIVRTVITVVAGVARMSRRRYLTLSAIGAVAWVFGVTLLGFFLGRIPFVRDNIEPHIDLILLGVIVLSVLPPLIHLVRERHRSRRSGRTVTSGESEEPTADADAPQR